jgi:hypothetical protein
MADDEVRQLTREQVIRAFGFEPAEFEALSILFDAVESGRTTWTELGIDWSDDPS